MAAPGLAIVSAICKRFCQMMGGDIAVGSEHSLRVECHVDSVDLDGTSTLVAVRMLKEEELVGVIDIYR